MSTFLDNYLTYCSGNESPQVYHRWAGLSVLSSIIGRRVWIDQGIYTAFPNLYVVLVGEPGNGKSVAMSIGRKMVRSFDHVVVAPSSITREKITQLMGHETSPCRKLWKNNDRVEVYTQLSFFANELVTLLGTAPIGMIQFFTDIYDEERFEVATKGAGCDNIEAPYITLLGCMTPEITSSLLKQNIISGGFNRRCMFINAIRRGQPHSRPSITSEQADAWSACLAWCHSIKELSGKFTWGVDADLWYDNWYDNIYYPTIDRIHNFAIKGYYRTKSVMLLKVAMLISLSERRDLVLDIGHLRTGLAWMEETEHLLPRVFDGTGRNELSDVSSKIMSMLETTGTPINEKTIRINMHSFGTDQEISDVIQHLISTDRVRRQNIMQNSVVVGSAIALLQAAQTDSSPTPTVPVPSPISSQQPKRVR